jgi:ABC-type multidrug transport system fused ATPase/permease subunit
MAKNAAVIDASTSSNEKEKEKNTSVLALSDVDLESGTALGNSSSPSPSIPQAKAIPKVTLKRVKNASKNKAAEKKKSNDKYHDDDEAENNVSSTRLLALAKPEWYWMAFAIFLLVIISLSNLLVPFMFGELIDAITDTDESMDERREKLRNTVFQLFAVMVFSSFLVIGRGLIFNASGERVVARLRIDLFKAVMNQEIAFFDTRPTGELLSRLSSDTAKLQDAATTSISIFLRNLFTLILSLILLFVTSWKLALLTIVSVPLLVVVIVIYGRYIKKLSKKYTDHLAKAADISSQSISSIRTCRSFAAEDVEVNKFARYIGDPDDVLDKTFWWFAKAESTYQLGMYKAMSHGLFLGFIMGLAQVTLVGLLWYGGELVLDGELSAGKLITFVMYSLNIAAALGSFASLFASWMEAIGASTRTFEIIDRKPEPLKGGKKRFSLSLSCIHPYSL